VSVVCVCVVWSEYNICLECVRVLCVWCLCVCVCVVWFVFVIVCGRVRVCELYILCVFVCD